MGLRHSYTLIAPIYDLAVAAFTHQARSRSLLALQEDATEHVLLVGVGSGLDIPLLSPGPRYIGIDLTPAMLARARRKAAASALDIHLELGDAGTLPYAAGVFDVVIMHLILAVVPHAEQVLTEAARVLRPGGRVLILDKFLNPGQKAPVRRLLSPLLGSLVTRTDVVFEELLSHAPELQVRENRPALLGGWFRHIVLERGKHGSLCGWRYTRLLRSLTAIIGSTEF